MGLFTHTPWYATMHPRLDRRFKLREKYIIRPKRRANTNGLARTLNKIRKSMSTALVPFKPIQLAVDNREYFRFSNIGAHLSRVPGSSRAWPIDLTRDTSLSDLQFAAALLMKKLGATDLVRYIMSLMKAKPPKLHIEMPSTSTGSILRESLGMDRNKWNRDVRPVYWYAERGPKQNPFVARFQEESDEYRLLNSYFVKDFSTQIWTLDSNSQYNPYRRSMVATGFNSNKLFIGPRERNKQTFRYSDPGFN